MTNSFDNTSIHIMSQIILFFKPAQKFKTTFDAQQPANMAAWSIYTTLSSEKKTSNTVPKSYDISEILYTNRLKQLSFHQKYLLL